MAPGPQQQGGQQQGGQQQGGQQQGGQQQGGQQQGGQQQGGQQQGGQQGGQQQAAQSGSQAASNSGSVSPSSSTLSIPQTAPPGILTITQPPQTATSFYKLAPSQPITFGWNVSYLLVTPTSLTVSAICENGNTYPVGPTDGIIPGSATSVVWDPWAYDQANPNMPLAMATYTLNIWGDGGPSAARAPGVLEPNSALQFALYTTQPYTPLTSGWQCSVCSSGSLTAYTAHPAFVGLVAMLVIMFSSGFTLLRR